MTKNWMDLFVKLARTVCAAQSHPKNYNPGLLRVGRLRRTLLDRAVAALLVILLAPSLSLAESPAAMASGAGVRTLHAQIIGGCNTPYPANAIVQTVCAGGVIYAADLTQFESDSVNTYLALHNLPSSDAHLIYDAGRADLRNAVRATMLATLVGIIQTPAAARTVHQQSLYTWFQYLMQQNEIADYTAAISQYHTWQNDPCTFTLDPVIAAQYGLSYDGAPFCSSLGQLYGGPPMPAESYFLAYGLSHSYGKAAQTSSNFGAVVAGTGLSFGEVVGIGAGAGAVVGAGLGVGIAASLALAIATGGAVGAELFVSATAAAGALGPIAIAAGPAAIVFIAITIGVAAGFQAFSNEKTVQDLNNLNNTLNLVTKTKPDLNSFATDTTGLGMLKMTETLASQTLPDFPSTAALPAHTFGTDSSFSVSVSGGAATISQTLTYQDWEANTWSAQTSGGWFVQTCTSGATCLQADSLLASIHYVDWIGTKWIGSRIGLNFVSTKLNPASTDVACPANGTTKVSPGTDFSACSSYVSSSIPLKDANGSLLTVSLTFPPLAPVFSASNLVFTAGGNTSRTITASGSPTPTVSLIGAPPPGFVFFPGLPGTGLLFENAAQGAGSYPMTLVASSTAGTTTQTFTITVTPALQITSASTLVATAGIPVNFLVTTTGVLPMSLSWGLGASGNSTGLTFVDNGNGTATISGTSFLSGAFVCIHVDGQPPCGITATNQQGTTSQSFTVVVDASPIPVLAGATSATFVARVENSIVVISKGALTPVSWPFGKQGYPAPSWLSFHDNGDGSGVLSGKPPGGTPSTFAFTLQPVAAGNPPYVIITSPNFTLNVNDGPVFVSPSVATLTVGTPADFPIKTNGLAVRANGITFPKGLAFEPGYAASITGAPAPGTGGEHVVPLTASDPQFGSTTQMLTLDIDEAPQITSASSATFFTGVPGAFAVTTTGYPSISTKPLLMDGTKLLPPTNPGQGQGMFFDVAGLTHNLHASNLNAEGLATGTLTIEGTPSLTDAGLHYVQIFARNGVGALTQQALALNILRITGPAPTSGKTCNGNYNGTFQGEIEVSAGQNCSFVNGGGVTGDVTVKAGTFAMTNGTVSGHVRLLGSAAFSLGQGTRIGGNLVIHDVSSGTTLNQVCGTTVLGNLDVTGTATLLSLGSALPDSCPGNRISGTLAIHENTMPLAVYNNAVGKTLSCTNNASIKGGGNTAQKKTDQCAAF